MCALCPRSPTIAPCVHCGRRCCRRCLDGDIRENGGTGVFECKACWGVEVDGAPQTPATASVWVEEAAWEEAKVAAWWEAEEKAEIAAWEEAEVVA